MSRDFRIVCLFVSIMATGLAAGVVYDDMSAYPDGGVSFFNKGDGWQGGWQVGPGSHVVARNSDAGSRIEVSGDNTVRALIRRLARPAGSDGKPVYFRCDYSMEASEADIERLFGGWYFVDAKGYNASLPGAILCVREKAGARMGDQSAELKARSIKAGDRHTLVARLDGWDPRTKTFSTLSVWLDPSRIGESVDPAPQVTVRSDLGPGPIELLYFRIYNMGDAKFHIYGVRFAASWAQILES